MPAGARQPTRPAAYWSSDDEVSNLEMLAPWLVSIFATSGLWPLLWRFEEDPQNYMHGGGDFAAADAIDVATILRTRWDKYAARRGDTGTPVSFPGLAAGTPGPSSGIVFPPGAFHEPARLILVPCNRPADAILTLGGIAGEADAPIISAVLRSWEQRFGAIAYEVAPTLVRLSVTQPPGDEQQAHALAAEHLAISARYEERPIDDLTQALLSWKRPATANPSQLTLSRDTWDVAW